MKQITSKTRENGWKAYSHCNQSQLAIICVSSAAKALSFQRVSLPGCVKSCGSKRKQQSVLPRPHSFLNAKRWRFISPELPTLQPRPVVLTSWPLWGSLCIELIKFSKTPEPTHKGSICCKTFLQILHDPQKVQRTIKKWSGQGIRAPHSGIISLLIT